MRRTKIISAISLIILCASMLCVGVIASDVTPQVGMGGVINVPANSIGVTVKGYINCVSEDGTFLPSEKPDFDSSSKVYENNQDENGEPKVVTGSAWQFTQNQLKKMTFDLSRVNDLNDLRETTVTITFEITNKSDLPLCAYFKEVIKDDAGNVESENKFKDTFKKDFLPMGKEEDEAILKVSFGEINYMTSQTGNDTYLISMIFSPLIFVEEDTPLPFNYTLQVEETAPVVNPEE